MKSLNVVGFVQLGEISLPDITTLTAEPNQV